MLKEIKLTEYGAALVVEALKTLSVEISGNENRANDFDFIEWLAEDMEREFNLEV